MNVLTHFASLDVMAFGGDLDQGTSSRVQRGKCSTRILFVSFKARSAVGLSHGSFSSVVAWDLTEELAIDFAQWTRHADQELL